MSTAAEAAVQLQQSLGLSGLELRFGLSQDELFHEAIANDRGRVECDGPTDAQKAFPTALGIEGPLVFYTDPACTGRPVNDTFCVDRASVTDLIWWKKGFAKFDPDAFDALVPRVIEHLNRRGRHLYVADLFCGSDIQYSEPCRFVGEYATHAYFCNIMLPHHVRDDSDRAEHGWTVLNVPSYTCDPERDGTRSERAVIIDIEREIALVLGAADYCGINKKAMFTIMNFVLPSKGQLSMHSSANVGQTGDTALLFGLSGTGKTTLSADSDRELIGDDEHVWTDLGISNLEHGCYAKLINLDKTAEPVIAEALSMKGTLIENVPQIAGKSLADTDPQELDLDDGSITENTRFAYPLSANPNVAPGACGPHPESIVLLTADAFGVLPPVSILDPEETMYHFVMGFTSKLAGTEVGVTEPEPSFSGCFGAAFMSQKPFVYAELLARRMAEHNSRCILLNTGWSGGPYGTGERMSLKVTRRLLNAALWGEFDDAELAVQPILGLKTPTKCDGVDSTILNPRDTWDDPESYDQAATKLCDMFRANYTKQGYEELGIAAMM